MAAHLGHVSSVWPNDQSHLGNRSRRRAPMVSHHLGRYRCPVTFDDIHYKSRCSKVNYLNQAGCRILVNPSTLGADACSICGLSMRVAAVARSPASHELMAAKCTKVSSGVLLSGCFRLCLGCVVLSEHVFIPLSQMLENPYKTRSVCLSVCPSRSALTLRIALSIHVVR